MVVDDEPTKRASLVQLQTGGAHASHLPPDLFEEIVVEDLVDQLHFEVLPRVEDVKSGLKLDSACGFTLRMMARASVYCASQFESYQGKVLLWVGPDEGTWSGAIAECESIV